MSYKGKFSPKHPEKYTGTYPIVWRSTWERTLCSEFDENPNVLHWSSESMYVKYFDPPTQKMRKYFPDFIIQARTETGIKITMIEVKPYKQTMKPKVPVRKTKRYISECMTYATNEAKWNAAKAYCSIKNWEFVILTEREIFGKKKE